MKRFTLAIVAFALSFASITYLLHLLFKNHRYIKYLPPVIALALGSYNIYLLRTAQTGGFEDIARKIMAIMLLDGFLAGTISGCMIDYILPKIGKKEESIED